MGQTEKHTRITNKIKVDVSVEDVWESWTKPEHIERWNQASDDWHTLYSLNDLAEGERFLSRMESKDGSFGFDFAGTYTLIRPHQLLAFTLDDGRKVEVQFNELEDGTEIIENFDADDQYSIEEQKKGWQAILESFKKYTETTFEFRRH
jgi:uncharacterized protein YndB with AHSA1/START domain